MLNEDRRTAVWEEWLSAEIRALYYADLARRHRRLQRWSTWATLLLSSGAAAALLARSSEAWIAPVLALLATGVSLYSLVAENLKNAMEASDLHFRWNKIANEYEDLWRGAWADDNALARLTELSERRAEASRSGTALLHSERRMLKWYDVVVRRRAQAA